MLAAVDGWFVICEAQFELGNISNEITRFYHIPCNLPPDLISNRPTTIITSKSFTKLRESVISMHEQSKPELFNRLIGATTMTGKPSRYLKELMATASKIGVGEELMRHKFIQALPTEITPVIAAVKNASVYELGTLADEIVPFFNQKYVHNVTAPPPSRFNRHTVSSSAAPRINYNLRPFYEVQKPQICRGHLYFADKSRTCKPWCKWLQKSNCKIMPTSRSSLPTRQASENLLCELELQPTTRNYLRLQLKLDKEQ